MKIWNLEYRISRREVLSDPFGSLSDQVKLILHRYYALKRDPHVSAVDMREVEDPSTTSRIYLLRVELKEGLTQPRNPELWHLDVLQGSPIPTWYERILADDI